MTDLAIKVENLSKRYRIGLQDARQETLVGTAAAWLKSPLNNFRRLRRLNAFADEEAEDIIWALRDVSFAVKHGEVVGIIGRNGAGKSTLLKILSRITPPTRGRVVLNGRVASLLEVGTGFHPELTGRENIYLNGTILGMTKAEIEGKFDEIVAFSGVEKFIDTPVKRYSSGMRVRLAFSVAAHLESEILLVDEVLAVGDAEFQKKCLGKMGDIAKRGRTVLFVSHNMAAIKQMCPRSLFFQSGSLLGDGDSCKVIESYLNSRDTRPGSTVVTSHLTTRSGIGGGRITRVEVENDAGIVTATFGIGEPLRIRLTFELDKDIRGLVAGVEIKTSDAYPLLNLRSDSQNVIFGPYIRSQSHQIVIDIPGLPLYPGSYLIEPWIAESKGRRLDHIHESINVSLESVGHYQSEVMVQQGRGILLMDCNWLNGKSG
jgi:lipopolysaccharide transport system ATP-binding protein